MTLKQRLIASLGFTSRVIAVNDPFGIDAALADRKANRSLYQALERSERTRKGNITRAQRKAGVA